MSKKSSERSELRFLTYSESKNNNRFRVKPGMTCNEKDKAVALGFTLAEILTTLAIIGVISVLTLPVLNSGVNEKVLDSQKKVFDSKLFEGLRHMQIKGALAQSYDTTDDFVKEMTKHMNINKVCTSDKLSQCFPNVKTSQTVTKYDLKRNNITKVTDIGGNPTNWSDVMLNGVVFNDGTRALIGYHTDCTIANKFDPKANLKECMAMMYDTNGNEGPNILGEDIDTVNIRYNGKDFEIGEIYSTIGSTYADCTAYQDQGIEVRCPKNLPLNENDYYAYAAYRCQSQGLRLPTRKELKDIAEQLYKTDTVGSNTTTTTNGIADQELWQKLGGQPIALWSSEESGDQTAFYRYFETNKTVETNAKTCTTIPCEFSAHSFSKRVTSAVKFFCVE